MNVKLLKVFNSFNGHLIKPRRGSFGCFKAVTLNHLLSFSRKHTWFHGKPNGAGLLLCCEYWGAGKIYENLLQNVEDPLFKIIYGKSGILLKNLG